MARKLWPIHLKSFLRLEEPPQWKGGTMQELWKKKGSLSRCKSFRGILLADDSGKSYHSSVRQSLGPYLSDFALEEQSWAAFHAQALTSLSHI